MTRENLKQAAIEYLGRVFSGNNNDEVTVVLVNAAVAIVLAPDDAPAS